MNQVLARWNQLPALEAAAEISSCCGSTAWADALAARRPLRQEELIPTSDEIWNGLTAQDWMEAFSKHPRIGQGEAPNVASGKSAAWSVQEQQSVRDAGEAVQSALARANQTYEERFGRIFIVCATGKSPEEMLDILESRLKNDDATELRVAAEEQRKITNLRLKKWLST